MKDITHYFTDPVKSGDAAVTNTSENAKQKLELQNFSKAKRNRVKIKISRTNAEERVCDIVESNSDMIDKTPSPFGKKTSLNKSLHGGTPKTSYQKPSPQEVRAKSEKQQFVDNAQILTEVDLNHTPANSNESLKKHTKGRKHSKVRQSADTVNKHKDKSNNKKTTYKNTSSNNEMDIEIITLSNVDSDEEGSSQREESNAFQILMNNSKPVQNGSPPSLSPQDTDSNKRKSDDYKEKLKRSKEKLIVLADKKGYSKRKFAEIEEGERIERAIENRVKTFTGEKRDSGMIVANQKSLSGNLLNYFSKMDTELTHTDTPNISTFIVKADVHNSESSMIHPLYRTNEANSRRLSRKSRKPNVEFAEADDIKVVSSENISISHNSDQSATLQHSNKRRWSLRIKLQMHDDGNSLNGDTSDEELFSLKTKVKPNGIYSKKSEISKSTYAQETEPLVKSNGKQVSKLLNGHTKLKSRTKEQVKSLEAIQEKETQVQSVNEDIKADNKKHNVNLLQDRSERTDEKDCIIISDISAKRKSNDKLAPLFTKRRKPDPEAVAARKLFLQPVVTENDGKIVNRKVSISGILPFPAISHVTQANGFVPHLLDKLNIPVKTRCKYIPILSNHNYKSVTDFNITKPKPLKSANRLNDQGVEEALTEIETHCSDAKKIWQKVSLICNDQHTKKLSPKSRSKKGRLPEKKELNDNKSAKHQIESSMWTDKYKPLSSQDVVGNEEAAQKLRDWLNGWRSSLTNENASSGDEFYSSDGSCTNSNQNNQVAVLLGPHGSGKSASVYAVAAELGYTVLEVNASSRRTGKKLLKELEEATKSHRIKKDKSTTALFNSISKDAKMKKIPQKSLILLEDIDLIFEEDEGFISATYQLASNTKRPIVMTCRDVCSHLSKMAPQQNRIYFQNAVGNRVSALLELISLAETGCRVSHACMTELLQTGDLRKALLQLQYLLLSGGSQALGQSVSLKNSLWQNIRYALYKPAIKATKKKKTKKNLVNEATNENTTEALTDIANKLDNIALLSSLIDVQDPALNLSHTQPQPSLSLVEDTAPYSLLHSINSDIADSIRKKVIRKEEFNEYDGMQGQNSILLRKQLNTGVNLALSQVTTSSLDHQIVSIDYLPFVRAICRAEESRANMNNKRGNRFFHYLHSLKVPSTSLKPNILAAACKIMQDKTENDTHASMDNNSTL